ERGPILIRTLTAEAVDGADHERRPQFMQTLRREAHAGQDPGTEVFHQNIGLADQTRQDIASLRLTQIQPYRAFVPIKLGEIPRQPVSNRAPAADGIAFGRLDLQYVSAEVSQQSGAKRPR